MYSQGTILYFDPFYFKNGQKNKPKYFIVLHNNNSDTVLVSLPTRGDFVPSDIKLLHGCINDDSINFNCYHFEAKKVITTNGWCFELPTFLYGGQIDEYKLNILNSIYIVENVDYHIMGVLEKEEFKKIIECFLNSGSVKRKFKPLFKTLL